MEETMLIKRKPIEWVVQPNGCWNCVSHADNGNGYKRLYYLGKSYPVHRFIFQELFGELPANILVRHKCDNRACINPEHLEPGTHADNCRDKIERGRARYDTPRGEEHPFSKLTAENVRYIRESNESIRKLAKRFGVSHTTISMARLRKDWKHIQ